MKIQTKFVNINIHCHRNACRKLVEKILVLRYTKNLHFILFEEVIILVFLQHF